MAQGTTPKTENSQKSKKETTSSKSSTKSHRTKSTFPKKLVLDALKQSSDDEGWANLGTFGSYLNKLQPDFDSRMYGYKKLSQLVKSRTDVFVTEERAVAGAARKVLYIRAT